MEYLGCLWCGCTRIWDIVAMMVRRGGGVLQQWVNFDSALCGCRIGCGMVILVL